MARPGTGQSRPGTAQARAAAAIKAAGGLEHIAEMPGFNPTAIPPAMVPEGWLRTEGGSQGPIPIKPHRTPRYRNCTQAALLPVVIHVYH
jgi:hypothetical protein